MIGARINRRGILTGAVAIPVLGLSSGGAAEYAPTDPWNPAHWTRPAGLSADRDIDLWPDGALSIPDGLTETMTQRSDDPLASDRILAHITRPRLAVFVPPKPNGASVIIAPGGGYRYCVVDKEGFEIARLFAARGVTAFVLFYRMPNDGWAEGHNAPLADAQRAVRLVRARAATMNLDPMRVTMMGFSAGGHVAASVLTRAEEAVYMPVEAIDTTNARPNAGALLYPVISMDPAIAHAGSRDRLIGPAPDANVQRATSADERVGDGTPPTFLLFAEDDRIVPVENGLRFRAAMTAAGRDIETHLFARGGHGFGLKQTAALPVAAWPELLWRWMQDKGMA